MFTFWISVALISALTLWLLWRPLNSRSSLQMESVQQRNIAIANERANEINSAFDTGEISQAERDQAMQDLELSLADELASSNELENQFGYASRTGNLAILALIPLLAFASYSLTNNYQSDWETAEQERLANAEAPPLEDIMVQLEAAVDANPDDQRGLMLLARSYAQLGDFARAAQRFEQLVAVAEPNADLLVSYVDASAMANGRRFDEKMRAALDQALELDPNHVSGLWLAGLANQQLGHPDTALRHWLTLQPMLAGNPEANQELTLLINSAREQLGSERAQAVEAEVSAKQTDTITASDSEAVASVQVRVSLAPELQAEVDDADTVFVYARAASGPPMPLAAVRQPVTSLPLTLTLDDSMAMMPQMKLSGFREIVVGARISKSGQATAQSGDLESDLVATVNDHPDTIELVISKRRP